MAALAVKANVAIQNTSTKDDYHRKKARISTVLLVNRSASSENYSKINDGFEYNKQIAHNQLLKFPYTSQSHFTSKPIKQHNQYIQYNYINIEKKNTFFFENLNYNIDI